jgi:hypothetical protein
MNTIATAVTMPHDHLSETFLALLELVECKDIKDQLERLAEDTGCTDAQQSNYLVLKSSYDKRKPAAWEKAREVLYSCGWHKASESQPEEHRMLLLILSDGTMRCGTFDPFFGTPGKKDGFIETRATKRGKTKDWIEGVIAWSYAQLPRF